MDEKAYVRFGKSTKIYFGAQQYIDAFKDKGNKDVEEGNCIRIFSRLPNGKPMPPLYASHYPYELYLGSPTGPAQETNVILKDVFWIYCPQETSTK